MTPTIYSTLGDENLQKMLDEFYDLIFESEIGHLFNKTEKEIIKDKQFCFLTQFLGGPQRYIAKYGQPKMRLRHLPHKIDQNAKEVWLGCMKKAINTLDIDEQFKVSLYNCFPKVAEHMVNS
jgi:hemoglobin